MTAAGLPSSEPGGSPLSIGSVLDALRADFPEITISKIRFLESEGLISPARTPAGYRQFSHTDVARLRFVLSAQRDHYLPLKVIRAKLEEFDRDPGGGALTLDAPPATRGPVAGGPSGPQGPAGPAVPETPAGSGSAAGRMRTLASVADRADPHPGGPETDPDGAQRPAGGSRVGREVRLAEDGVDAALLEGLENHGILRPDPEGRFEPEDVVVARTAAALSRLGVEPRLLRSARAGAEREVGLLTQLVTPVARGRAPEAGQRAEELSEELAALSGRLHALLVGAGLRQTLRR